jgi:hypothetical protein
MRSDKTSLDRVEVGRAGDLFILALWACSLEYVYR